MTLDTAWASCSSFWIFSSVFARFTANSALHEKYYQHKLCLDIEEHAHLQERAHQDVVAHTSPEQSPPDRLLSRVRMWRMRLLQACKACSMKDLAEEESQDVGQDMAGFSSSSRIEP